MYNTIDSGGGEQTFWSDAEERVEDAGGDGDDLESVTLESEGTSGDYEVTDLTLSGDFDPEAMPDQQALTLWESLEGHEKALVVATGVLLLGSVALTLDGGQG